MTAHNSRIQAAGVGKDSKRHDLDGTPGLAGSDLQYGDVQKLEQGQKTLKNTNQARDLPQSQAALVQSTAGPTPNIGVPDAITFAKQKLGGTSLEDAGRERIEVADFQRWMPFLERIASSPTSSGILQRAFVDRLSKELSRPLGGSAAVIRQRDFDKRLKDFNAGQ